LGYIIPTAYRRASNSIAWFWLSVAISYLLLSVVISNKQTTSTYRHICLKSAKSYIEP